MPNYLEERLRNINLELSIVKTDADRQMLLDERQFILELMEVDKDIVF